MASKDKKKTHHVVVKTTKCGYIHLDNRDLQIGVRVRLFNSCFYASDNNESHQSCS